MKKQVVYSLGSALAFLGSATGTFAAPTFYPGRPGALQDVVNHTRATVIADTQDPKKAYVIPPTSGEGKASDFKGGSANLGFCSQMADLQGASRRIAAKIAEKDEEIAEMRPELDRLKVKSDEAAAELAKVMVSNEVLKQLDHMVERVQEIELRLNELYDRQLNCGQASRPSCQSVEEEIAALQKEKKENTKTILNLRKQAGADYLKYQRAKSAADSARQAYDDGLLSLDKIVTALSQARENLLKMYGSLGSMHGGYVDLTYDTGWDQAVETLRQDNRGYEFAKIPTRAAKIFANFIGTKDRASYLASLPAILDYTVNGQAIGADAVKDEQLLAAMPDKFFATVRLSLVGGCPLHKPELFDIKKENTGIPIFAVTAAYDFSVAFRTKVKFSYNLYQFYELIKKSGSSGGLFSSRSWSKVTEDRVSHDTFLADWDESDPDHALSDAEKRAVEKEVKEELIGRVLKHMAVPVVDGSPQLAGAPRAPASGAIVVAEGLEKTCGYYSFYCAGGAWLLRGLNAIFGSSSTEESYRSTANKTAEEIWNRTTVRWKPAVTVMGPKA